jgi:FkbH-like protein
MLLCLCSKNVEEDVFEVLDAHPDMILRRKDIVASKINWQPKSQNLRSLAGELGLGLDSFIFVDDNPVECSEVEAGCPEVLTLLLPEPERIPHFLKHVWAFDTLKVTEEDRQRSELYRQNVQREVFQGTAMSFQGFLEGLGLEIEISPMRPEHLARVAQLTQRTNQFNCTTIRRTEAEIKNLCDFGYECLIVNVKDRFGDYGLVGTVLFTKQQEALYVDSLMLSCRVLGRGVEHRILVRLGEIARERGAGRVDVAFRPTKKNRPALDFLRIGEAFQQEATDGSVFRLPVDFALAVAFVPGGASPEAPVSEEQAAPAAAAPSSEAPSRSALLCRIAHELSDASSILNAVEAQRQHMRPEVAETYLAPRSPLEASLAEIWSSILGVERVGVRDDFFELGGWSLLAVHLFIEIEKTFGQSLPLTTLLTAPTIEKLAMALENRTGSKIASVLVPIQTLGSRPAFFCVHGARGKVLGFRSAVPYLGLDQPFFALQAKDLEDDEVERVTVESLAANYLDAIRAVQPEGPYLLGGNCFGSFVALEMARMLRDRNQEVALLALFDPDLLRLSSLARHPLVTARCVASQIVKLARRPVRTNLAHLQSIVHNVLAGTKDRWTTAPRNDGSGSTMPESGAPLSESSAPLTLEDARPDETVPRQIQNIFYSHRHAARVYRPRPYPGPIRLFLASANSTMKNAISEAEWRDLAQGGLEVQIVPSSHGAFFDEPDVQAFCQMLGAALDQACAGLRGEDAVAVSR